MAIIRELLIRLGFQTDKRAINQTNQAITGFRTRFALIATAATFAFSKIAGFFGDIAKATLESNDLAKSLGISLSELTQIQGAAKQVGRLDFKQTGQALGRVQTLLTNFRKGTDDTLGRIAEAFQFKIDKNAGPAELFDQILKGLANIENEARRIEVGKLIFGEDLGVRISDLAVNFNQFKEAIPNFKQLGTDTEASLQAAKNYATAIDALTTAWSNFTLKLGETVIPLLTHLTNILTGLSDVYLGLFTFDSSIISKGLKSASAALDPLFNATGLNKIPEIIGKIVKSDTIQDLGNNIGKFVSNPEGFQSPSMLRAANAVPIIINSEFNVNVPQGTTEEMASYLTEDVNESFRKLFSQQLQHIQNNNPVVE